MSRAAEPMSRAQYLDDLVARLWPTSEPTVTARSRSFVVLPRRDDPRLVVPLAHRHAAAAAVRATVHPSSFVRRVARVLLSAGFRTGLAPWVLRGRLAVPDDGMSLVAALEDTFGSPLDVLMRVGPSRANRKPVLQLVRRDGTVLGYAKVGTTPLAAELVTTEARTLEVLAAHQLRDLEVPKLLHVTTYRGMPVVVQSALDSGRTVRPRSGRELTTAMVEVSRLGGTSRGTWAGSVRRRQLGVATTAVHNQEAGGEILRLVSRLDEVPGLQLTFGSWHGDWNAGNFMVQGGRVLVWDWERFETGVPVGFDALHLALQTAVTVRGRAPAVAAASVHGALKELLAPWDVTGQEAAATWGVYLAELGVRYLRDRQCEAGAAIGRVEEWLVPALGKAVAAAAPGETRGGMRHG